VAYVSLLDETKAFAAQLGNILSGYDITELPQRERELATNLKNQLIDIRLDVQAYEYAQTRAEQVAAAHEAKERLAQLEKIIIKASEYNLFGVVDVAQLSARAEQLISRLA
jgi:hypothetical protein